MAPVNAPTFKEILRQAQFGGYTTAILINGAMTTFPWDALTQVGGLLAGEYQSFLADAANVNGDAFASYGSQKPRGNVAYQHDLH